MTKSAVVAGVLCLDIFPDFSRVDSSRFLSLFQPGKMVEVGPAAFSTGGAVSNTGQALHKLGIPTRLIAKVGADFFGNVVRELIQRVDPALAEGIKIDREAHTSYSVVINPPGIDRIFLHDSGANNTFIAGDIDRLFLAQADLLHFGYPPAMRTMYEHGGRELVRLFREAKGMGITTSVDMSFPDPTTAAAQADWNAILQQTLPYVDIFLPSIEEILFMLWRDVYDRLVANGGVLQGITQPLLEDLSQSLIEMGAKIVGIKMGDRGFILRTATNLAGMGRAAPEDPARWQGQQIWMPCFQVDVAGTTGSGDATIAGFLAALLRGLPPEQAAQMAVAVGACNVEAADALSGIRTWEETVQRIQAGWAQRKPLPHHSQ